MFSTASGAASYLAAMRPLLPEDIAHVLTHAERSLREMRGWRIFITGGTGFFGCWLLETLLAARASLGTATQLTVLSRDPDRFAARVPHLGRSPRIRWVRGDILELTPDLMRQQLGEVPRFDAMIHLVTEGDMAATANDPVGAMRVIAMGTERALAFAAASGCRRFLFTSSGAVYGWQPLHLARIPEDFTGAPATTDAVSPYAAPGQAKRYAETLCSMHAAKGALETVIARCFTFHGPHLPLDAKFAVGNFLRSALERAPLVIKGDGTPVRSYLYAADLAIWLHELLVRGASGAAYNVGSEMPVSVRELARTVVGAAGCDLSIEVLGKTHTSGTDRYVPETRKARDGLGLQERIELRPGLERTLRWLTD